MAVLKYIPFNERVVRGDADSTHFRGWNEGGVPIDVSGWTLFHTAKRRLNDEDDDAKIKRDSDNDPTAFTFYDSGSLLDPPDLVGFDDSFSVNYLPADTGLMIPQDYEQDLQIIKVAAGSPKTYGLGVLTIIGDVTRRTTT